MSFKLISSTNWMPRFESISPPVSLREGKIFLIIMSKRTNSTDHRKTIDIFEDVHLTFLWCFMESVPFHKYWHPGLLLEALLLMLFFISTSESFHIIWQYVESVWIRRSECKHLLVQPVWLTNTITVEASASRRRSSVSLECDKSLFENLRVAVTLHCRCG